MEEDAGTQVHIVASSMHVVPRRNGTKFYLEKLTEQIQELTSNLLKLLALVKIKGD